MKKVVIATNNAGKLREIRAILAPFGYEAVSQREAGFDVDVEENGKTFAENATIKAQAVFEALHTPVIADDSGLMVDALDGAPGVYSHRFAGTDADDAARNEKLLSLLENTPPEKRTARFVCAICYLDENGMAHHFEGKCEGTIGTVPIGDNGFGYDPLFVCGDKTMAQMTDAEKNQVSHRADALEKLKEFLNRSKLC